MKKIVIGVAIASASLFLILIVMVALSPKNSGATGGVAIEDGILTVGVPIDLSLNGFHWEETTIAQRVGDILGVPVELVPILEENNLSATRTQRLETLNSGEVDLLLAQMGWDTSFEANYFTSISYGSGGIYIGNPLGTYVDTLSVLDGATLFVSDLIPTQVMVEIPFTKNVTQSPQQSTMSLMQEFSLAEHATREEYYLFSEEQAIIFSMKGDYPLHIMPLLNSPRMDYVAVANQGEGALISACNQAITEYLDEMSASQTEETINEEG